MTERSHDHAIGALQAQLTALTKAVEHSAAKSEAGRRRTFEQLESIRLDASHTKRSVDDLHEWKDRNHAAWKSGVDHKLTELEKWKQRGIGALWPISAVIAIVSAGVAVFWKWLLVKIGLGG